MQSSRHMAQLRAGDLPFPLPKGPSSLNTWTTATDIVGTRNIHYSGEATVFFSDGSYPTQRVRGRRDDLRNAHGQGGDGGPAANQHPVCRVSKLPAVPCADLRAVGQDANGERHPRSESPSRSRAP
jgi:hypothetical protein